MGVFGLILDVCGILEVMENGYEGVKLVFEVFIYCVVKYIGFYFILLDYLDVIIFTGGIGENLLLICCEIFGNLKLFGFVEDEKGNEVVCFGKVGIIVKFELFNVVVMVILINEEFVIV